MTKKQLKKENKKLRQGFKELINEATIKINILNKRIDSKNKLFESEINRFNEIHNKQFSVAENEIDRLNTIIDYLENKNA